MKGKKSRGKGKKKRNWRQKYYYKYTLTLEAKAFNPETMDLRRVGLNGRDVSGSELIP